MPEPVADVATALALGGRHRQEDAVVADFADGADAGFAVLSDGMGGHDDGDLASRVIVSKVFAALSLSGRAGGASGEDIPGRLHDAVQSANRSLQDMVARGSGKAGMGGTVITVFIRRESLRWISIGDSALYLFRRDRLWRLNENHSLGPQIDMLVRQGAMDAETARNHPQRACLTSALVGAAISRIDCPEEALPLLPGDIVLLASDGLQVLADERIRRILSQHRHRPSRRIARVLLDAVGAEDEPGQDNTSVIVIKPCIEAAAQAETGAARAGIQPFWHQPARRFAALRRLVLAPLSGRPAP